MRDKHSNTSPVHIQLQGFEEADMATVQAALHGEFPGADIGRTVCLAESTPSFVEVCLLLKPFVASLALPGALLLIAKIVEKGKAVKEGIEGWIDVYDMVFPNRERRLRRLAHKLSQIEPSFQSLSVAARVRLPSGKWPSIIITNDLDPDDQLAVFAALAESIEWALSKVEAAGGAIGNGLVYLELLPEGFSVLWHDELSRAECRCLFSFAEGIADSDRTT